MFTTGSKLLFGASALAIAAFVVLGATNGGAVGWTATIGLCAAAVALVFVAVINLSGRDSTVTSLEPGVAERSAAAQRTPGASIWPLLAAVGAALLVVGLVTYPVVFKAGLVVLLATIVEWMIHAWSERASADPAYNAGVRARLLHPLEFPILGAVGLAVVIYSFSRIMLFISKDAGPAIFAVLAGLVLLIGILVAYAPSLKQSVVIGVSVIAGLGLVSTGAVMALDGERAIEAHETASSDPAICSSNAETDFDHHASQTVAAKSNVAATLTLSGGVLTGQQVGMSGGVSTITLQRGTESNVIFVNEDAEPVRLTAQTGLETASFICTALVEEGGRQLLTLRMPQSTLAGTESPYYLKVPGLDASTVTFVVP